MTAEPIRELSRPEFAQQVRDGIEAYDNGKDPYLEEVHCHIARKLGYTEKEIDEGVRQPWLDAQERVRKVRALAKIDPVELKSEKSSLPKSRQSLRLLIDAILIPI
jgi:hypothetical protein